MLGYISYAAINIFLLYALIKTTTNIGVIYNSMFFYLNYVLLIFSELSFFLNLENMSKQFIIFFSIIVGIDVSEKIIRTIYLVYNRNTILENNPPQQNDNNLIININPVNNINRQEYIYNNSNQIYNQSMCSICLDVFNENEHLIKLNCNHYFHNNCINNWFVTKTNCPNCNMT